MCIYICMYVYLYINIHTYIHVYIKKGAKEKEKVVGRKKKKIRKSHDEAPQYCLGSTLSFELLLAGFWWERALDSWNTALLLHPSPSPHPPSPGCDHLRGQKLPRVNNSLQQSATSFEPRLCNPITEQISLVEHQKRKREGRKKTRRALGRWLGRSGEEAHFLKGEGRLGTSNRTGPWTV